jgi:hypothetical protein
LRGHLVGDESIFTFTSRCADFRDPTAVFRFNQSNSKMLQRTKFAVMDEFLDILWMGRKRVNVFMHGLKQSFFDVEGFWKETHC